MDDEYVQEHILTGGFVAPVAGGLADSFMAAYSHFVQRCRVTPDTSAACSALRACVVRARSLAERLAGHDARYPGNVNATNPKVSGVHVFSAGDFLGAPGTEPVVLSDHGLGIYRKLVIAGGRVVGEAPSTGATKPPVKICS